MSKFGDKYEDARYAALAEDTEQEAHMAHVALSYEAGPLSERQGIKQQIVTSIYLSSVLDGKNIPDSQAAGLDLQILF